MLISHSIYVQQQHDPGARTVARGQPKTNEQKQKNKKKKNE